MPASPRLGTILVYQSRTLEFTNKVNALAEQEDHHPLIITEYGRAAVIWWTHKIGGLHKNDFIMAAKTDAARSLNISISEPFTNHFCILPGKMTETPFVVAQWLALRSLLGVP